MEKTKNMFDHLAVMNDQDSENGTQFLGVCNQVIGADIKGTSATVTIGVPNKVVKKYMLGDKNQRLILLIIDFPTYEKIAKA